MVNKVCISCKTQVVNQTGSISFKCPSCDKEKIVRCPHCRKTGVRYNCSCGFTGPN